MNPVSLHSQRIRWTFWRDLSPEIERGARSPGKVKNQSAPIRERGGDFFLFKIDEGGLSLRNCRRIRVPRRDGSLRIQRRAVRKFRGLSSAFASIPSPLAAIKRCVTSRKIVSRVTRDTLSLNSPPHLNFKCARRCRSLNDSNLSQPRSRLRKAAIWKILKSFPIRNLIAGPWNVKKKKWYERFSFSFFVKYFQFSSLLAGVKIRVIL